MLFKGLFRDFMLNVDDYFGALICYWCGKLWDCY